VTVQTKDAGGVIASSRPGRRGRASSEHAPPGPRHDRPPSRASPSPSPQGRAAPAARPTHPGEPRPAPPPARATGSPARRPGGGTNPWAQQRAVPYRKAVHEPGELLLFQHPADRSFDHDNDLLLGRLGASQTRGVRGRGFGFGAKEPLSIALVVQMIVRISRSKARNGTNSAQALSHSRTTAG